MKLTHIHPLFLALCVWGVPVHMILTHGDGVRLIQSPDPRPGVTHPFGQDTKAVVGGLKMCKQASSLGPPGTLERSVGIISPHNCPWEVRPLLFSLWFCVSFCWFEKIMLELNTLSWFWQTLVFLVPLRCWENSRAGLKDMGQVCSLWRRESTGRRPQQQPQLLPIDFLPEPCALEPIHQVHLPPYSTRMCWKIGIMTS